MRVVRRVGLQPSQAFLIANKRAKLPLSEASAVWSSANGNATSRADVAERLQWHVDVGVPLSCTVRPMARGSWVELEEAVGRLAAFVERTRLGGRARFTQLVADFLKGRDGRWYFLQVCTERTVALGLGYHTVTSLGQNPRDALGCGVPPLNDALHGQG